MKYLVKTMEALKQEDKILEQFYSTLANRPNTNVTTTMPLTPSATNTTSNDQELNYKMAAHDLISPLTTQFTLLDVLREELVQALQHIDSLAISNSESLKRSKAALGNQEEINQSIPFNKLIEAIVQLLGIRELHKNVDIVIQNNAKRPFYNNIAMVQSIMQNLIQNAVKYGKPNEKNTITLTIKDTTNGVEIIVQDTGIGMSKERVDQLFKQVIDSHANISYSHGFGLYGVAQYIEKLGGTIKAESTLHIGSTFTVTLPTLDH